MAIGRAGMKKAVALIMIGVRCNLPEYVSYYANGKVDYRIK